MLDMGEMREFKEIDETQKDDKIRNFPLKEILEKVRSRKYLNADVNLDS